VLGPVRPQGSARLRVVPGVPVVLSNCNVWLDRKGKFVNFHGKLIKPGHSRNGKTLCVTPGWRGPPVLIIRNKLLPLHAFEAIICSSVMPTSSLRPLANYPLAKHLSF
jgi:hypothetical protein